MEIPIEHQLKCKGCGKILDMRDPSILSHGWIENDEIICYEELFIPYSWSKEINKPVLWSNHKVQINLN